MPGRALKSAPGLRRQDDRPGCSHFDPSCKLRQLFLKGLSCFSGSVPVCRLPGPLGPLCLSLGSGFLAVGRHGCYP